MEHITRALLLLKRQAEIQNGLRGPRRHDVLEERELYLIRQWLLRHPTEVQAISVAAAELHRPIEKLSVQDVKPHA